MKSNGPSPSADDKEGKRSSSSAITFETIRYYMRRAHRLRAEAFFHFCKGLARKLRWFWRR